MTSPVRFGQVAGQHVLTASVTVEHPLEKVFAFFSDAANLDLLTPPYLRFEILTPDVEMGVGTLIDYRLRLRGIPIRWQSEITAWDPPHMFVDEQRRGPYRKWVHEHRFSAVGDSADVGSAPGGSTEVADRVEYAVPGGRLINALFVEPDLRRIFKHRCETIGQVLAGG